MMALNVDLGSSPLLKEIQKNFDTTTPLRRFTGMYGLSRFSSAFRRHARQTVRSGYI
jgi:hypothetical protein